MSLLDNVLGSLVAGKGGGLMELAGQLLQRAGGVQGLLKILADHGLVEEVGSWLGTGSNRSVSGDRLGQALEQGGLGDLLGQAAQRMGMNSGQLNSELAQMLPQVIDGLSPDGNAPADDGAGMDLSVLAGLAGKLFR